MKTIAISGSQRASVGKRDAKVLRYEGKVPCVLYGSGKQVHFAASAADLRAVLYTPEALFLEVSIEGAMYKAAVKDAQFHPVTDQILHVDFLEMFDAKPMNMMIPVKLTGSSPGVKKGGKLIQKFRKLTVRGLPKDFQDFIEINIDHLDLKDPSNPQVPVTDSVRVSDLSLKNLQILNAKSDNIVRVIPSRASKEAAAADVKK